MGAWDKGVWDNDSAWDLAADISEMYQANIVAFIEEDNIAFVLVYLDLLLMLIERSDCSSTIPDADKVNTWQFSIIRNLHRNKQSTTEASRLLSHLFDKAVQKEEDYRD